VLALRADGGWGTPKGAKRVAHVTIAPLDSGSLTARLNWRMGSGELRLSAVASVGSSATQVSVNGEAVEGARVRLNPGDVLQIREFKATLGGSGWDRLVLGVAVGKTVSLLLLLLGCAQLGGRNLFGELGFTLRGARAEVGRGVVALLAFLPVYVVGVMLTQLIGSSLGIPVESHPLVHAILEQGGTQLVLLVILQAVVLAPILEELLFRGFLLSAGARALGRPLGLLLSALCFALIHAGFASFLPMLGLGLLFGVLRLSSPERSIVGSITAHALFNALSLTLLFAAG
jgi:membrane protease YdiL (CAAX protease family)